MVVLKCMVFVFNIEAKNICLAAKCLHANYLVVTVKKLFNNHNSCFIKRFLCSSVIILYFSLLAILLNVILNKNVSTSD